MGQLLSVYIVRIEYHNDKYSENNIMAIFTNEKN